MHRACYAKLSGATVNYTLGNKLVYTIPLMIHVWRMVTENRIFWNVACDAWSWNIAPDVWFQNIASDASQTPARRPPEEMFRNKASDARFQNHASDVIFCDHASDVQYKSSYVPYHLGVPRLRKWQMLSWKSEVKTWCYNTCMASEWLTLVRFTHFWSEIWSS